MSELLRGEQWSLLVCRAGVDAHPEQTQPCSALLLPAYLPRHVLLLQQLLEHGKQSWSSSPCLFMDMAKIAAANEIWWKSRIQQLSWLTVID